jgi:hypothetical protein
MFKKIAALGSIAAGATAVASSHAIAALDVSTITADTSQVEVLTLTVLGGLAVIWAVRKLVKLMNRS